MRWLLPFILLGALATVSVGRNNRVYNGQIAEDKYRNGMALTFFYNQSADSVETLCTCQIINRRWVLTAAHCFYDRKIGTVGKVGSKLGVIPGALYRDGREAKSKGIFARKVYMDKRYLEDEIYDIALIELERRMEAETYTFVNFKSPPSGETRVMAAGYGEVENEENNPDDISYSNPPTGSVPNKEKIQQGLSTIKTTEYCYNEHDDPEYDFDAFGIAFLCTLYDSQTRSRVCFGDSGGPIFELRSDETLNSYGILSGGNECGPTDPDFYTKVSLNIVQDAVEIVRRNEILSGNKWYTIPGDLTNAVSTYSYPYYTITSSDDDQNLGNEGEDDDDGENNEEEEEEEEDDEEEDDEEEDEEEEEEEEDDDEEDDGICGTLPEALRAACMFLHR